MGGQTQSLREFQEWAIGLQTDNWETVDRGDWRSLCSLALQAEETRLKAEADERRAKRKAAANTAERVRAAYVFVCNDAAVPAILELCFLATSENACRNRAKSWTCPTTAYYYL